MSVGTLVARGEVALGFQQRSELIHLEGIHLLGGMPAEVAITTIFSGGVCAASRQGDTVCRLLAFLASPATADAKRRQGMESRLTPTPESEETPRMSLIIDCHGHYTTAPKQLEEWRNKQIAGIKDPSVMPRRPS